MSKVCKIIYMNITLIYQNPLLQRSNSRQASYLVTNKFTLEQMTTVKAFISIVNGLLADVSLKTAPAVISNVSSGWQIGGRSMRRLSHSYKSMIVVTPCTVDRISKVSQPSPPDKRSSPNSLVR